MKTQHMLAAESLVAVSAVLMGSWPGSFCPACQLEHQSHRHTQTHTNTLTHLHPRCIVPYPVAPLPGHQVSAGHKSQAQALFLPSAVPQHQVRVPTFAPKDSLWYRNTFPRFWLRNWKEALRGNSQGREGMKLWFSFQRWLQPGVCHFPALFCSSISSLHPVTHRFSGFSPL